MVRDRRRSLDKDRLGRARRVQGRRRPASDGTRRRIRGRGARRATDFVPLGSRRDDIAFCAGRLDRPGDWMWQRATRRLASTLLPVGRRTRGRLRHDDGGRRRRRQRLRRCRRRFAGRRRGRRRRGGNDGGRRSDRRLDSGRGRNRRRRRRCSCRCLRRRDGRGRRPRRRDRARRGGRRRRRRRRCPCREQALRIDVAVVLGRDPDAEMDARGRVFDVSARAHRPHRLPLGDSVALRDADRAEMEQRHRIAARREDRHPSAVRRYRPGERDRARRRGANRAAVAAPDVDTAVLSRGVRVRTDRKRAKHGPVGGPRPRERRPAQGERDDCDRTTHEKTMHKAPPSFPARATRPDVP